MGLQIYAGKGFDTQKAERFFKERRVGYQRVDVLRFGIGKRELESVIRAVGGMEQIVDPKDQDYALWQHLLPDAQFDMLLETPEMLRTPIVRNGQKATVGEAAAVWKQWIAEET